MKLLIVTAIKEDLHNVSVIMQKAAVAVFSVSETVGHKTEHHDYMPDNWFGKNEDGTDALFLFSFTDDDKAVKVLELVREHNKETKTSFPIRAFISPVEQSGF